MFTRPVLDWRRLSRLSEAELGEMDIAAVNLACATDLPGTEQCDVAICLDTLDSWASRVDDQLGRVAYAFERDSASYSNSWAYFRTLNLVTVLQRDLGLRYHKAEVPEAAEFETADQFIFGAIQGNGGTCATIPIVVIAVGRRLGYPLKLVSTKGHFFARWDDPSGERFNIEATNRGLTCFPDDHYRTWPHAMPEEMETECGFLQSMTPREELAAFVTDRAWCWQAAGVFREVVDSLAWAIAAAPERPYRILLLAEAIRRWDRKLKALLPTRFPVLALTFPPQRYEHLPLEVERQLICLRVLEAILEDPRGTHKWWRSLLGSSVGWPAGVPRQLNIDFHWDTGVSW